MKRVVGFSILAFFCFSLGFGWYVWDHFANRPYSDTSEEVVFEVKPGQGFVSMVKELEAQRLIRNASMFSLFAKIRGGAGKMKVGEYALNRNMYPSEILSIINSGKSIPHVFTVPEGLNIFEIAEMFEEEGYGTQKEFLTLVRDPAYIKQLTGEDKMDSLEGYLFPESYNLTKYSGAKDLISAMVKKFMSEWQAVAPLALKMGWSRHEVVILASIVEKETGAETERPVISSVFHNRMTKHMRLQTDPTVIYGKAVESGKVVISITRADLLSPTRYNTYVLNGLPPGPISNPGRDALMAATQPAATDYLYFVSRNDGTHVFSKDYKAHSDAVRKFQMDPRAREGKSWRDLKAKKKAG